MIINLDGTPHVLDGQAYCACPELLPAQNFGYQVPEPGSDIGELPLDRTGALGNQNFPNIGYMRWDNGTAETDSTTSLILSTGIGAKAQVGDILNFNGSAQPFNEWSQHSRSRHGLCFTSSTSLSCAKRYRRFHNSSSSSTFE